MAAPALAETVFPTPVATSTPARRPNVLLIVSDDLGTMLGSYGDATARSPNIDRLAGRAVQFDRAFVNQAVCSPSRNAVLLGMRPDTLGIYDLVTDFRRSRPDAVTLPQWFRQHGWRTECIGKIFHPTPGSHDDPASWSVPCQYPNRTRTDHQAGAAPGAARKGATPRSKDTASRTKGANAPGKPAAFGAPDVPDDMQPDGAKASLAIDRLRAAKAHPDEPFFLALGFSRPHLPFVAPKKYWDLHDRSGIGLASVRTPPAGAPKYAPQFGGELRHGFRGIPATGPLDDDLQRSLVRGYRASVSYMDAQVGRVLDELDRLGLAQDTIVILWGDNGFHLGDHGMWCKHTNYEQAVHVPLIVAAPGTRTGVRSGSLVENVDLFPTLCRLAGLPVPPGLDGRSFVATLHDPEAPTKDHVLHVYPRDVPGKGRRMGRAVRTERYRLVEWKAIGAPAKEAEIELYDYETDPLERENLAAARPRVVAKLRAMLARHPEAKPSVAIARTAAAPGQGHLACLDPDRDDAASRDVCEGPLPRGERPGGPSTP